MTRHQGGQRGARSARRSTPAMTLPDDLMEAKMGVILGRISRAKLAGDVGYVARLEAELDGFERASVRGAGRSAR